MKIVFKILKYFFGVFLGAVVSLTLAQQKFPPDFKVISNLIKAHDEISKQQAVVVLKQAPDEEQQPQMDDPYAEAKELHDRQMQTYQKLSAATGFNDNRIPAEAPAKPIPNPNLRVYKTKAAELRPSTPPKKTVTY